MFHLAPEPRDELLSVSYKLRDRRIIEANIVYSTVSMSLPQDQGIKDDRNMFLMLPNPQLREMEAETDYQNATW